eukprot:NODE_4745_length_1852_cov_9.995942.p1 GENE.NODE_4745_length_1852_cov_9.995942~~NODE_4745_length_1852_cov_9.995942.p1  ORF type:complete len:503 (-),score=109.58 NODE_4745_length_1852_cov_9.995942:343-1734(-)
MEEGFFSDVSDKGFDEADAPQHARWASYASAMDDLMVGIRSNDAPLQRHLTNRKLSARSDRSHLTPVLSFAKSAFFDRICACLIILNAASVAVDAELMMKSGINERSSMGQWLSIIFTALYFAELVLRIAAEGHLFFAPFNPDFQWNIFDVCLVIGSVVEELISHMSSTNVVQLSFLRLFRILRLLRILRITHAMRFLSELRLMLAGIKGSLRSLIWCVVLLMLTLLLFGLALMQLIVDQYGAADEGMRSFIDNNFGGLAKTLYTLVAAIMGGQDWREVSDALFTLGTAVGLTFIAYIAFAILCVLNIITGLYVQQSVAIMEKDAEFVAAQAMQDKLTMVSELVDLFSVSWKTNGITAVSLEEFKNIVSDQKVQAHLQMIGIAVDPNNAGVVFNLIDFDKSGLLDIKDLVTAFMNLSGSARQLTLARADDRIRKLQKSIDDIHVHMGLNTSRRLRENCTPVIM